MLTKKQIVKYNLVDNILYEKRMMEESDHPFVLKLINTFQDQDRLYMMLEVVPGESYSHSYRNVVVTFQQNMHVLFLHVSYLCLSTYTRKIFVIGT